MRKLSLNLRLYIPYGVGMIRDKFILASFLYFLAAVPGFSQTVQIAAFGDSLTAGYGLPVEDGFPAGGLARIDWALTPDIDAVIVELGANDLLRGLPPEAARENLDGIMSVISGRDYVDLAAKYEAIYYRNFLQGIGEAGDLAAIGALMQSDGLHPNRDGVEKVVAHIGPLVLELIAQINEAE